MPVAAAIRDENDSEIHEVLGAHDDPTSAPEGDGDVESRPWGEFPPGWTDFRAALRRYRKSMER